MHRGYTKRWRKRWDKDYCKDHLLFTMMEYFIDHANYKDDKAFLPNIGLIPLKRGQHIFGTRKLAEKLGVDRQRIRTKLNILKKIEFLTLKPTNRFSVASVINYDIYQPTESETNQQANQHLTSSQPAANQQLTIDKKDKNIKNVKNTTYTTEFLSFWETYPKKIGKGAAFNSWKRISKLNGLIAELMESLTKHLECEQWQKDNGQYIPNPTTWLNQRRWEDEIEVKTRKDPMAWREEALKHQ